MEVITTFYYTSKTEKLQLWIIFVSVLVGLLLLCTIATILNMVNFFFSVEDHYNIFYLITFFS